MEIICPSCRQVVIAVTRRLSCSHCSTPIDAWEILLGTRPAQTAASRPDTHVTAGASEPRDDFQNVVEVPPLLVPPSDTRELDPVLEIDFANTTRRRRARPLTTDSPSDFDARQSTSDFEASVGLSPSGEPRQRSRSAALIAVIAGLALGVVVLLYLFSDGAVSFVSRAGSGEGDLPAAGGLPGATPRSATETPQATPEPTSDTSPLLSPGTPSPAPTPTPTLTPTPTPTPGTTAVSGTAGTVPPETNPTANQEGSTRARTVTAPESSRGAFTLQVAARRKENEARQIAERLIEKGFDARLVTTGTEGNYWHRVRVGSFPTRQDAEIYGEQMKQAGAIAEYFVTDKRQ